MVKKVEWVTPTQLAIHTTGVRQVADFRLARPDRIVIDLYDALETLPAGGRALGGSPDGRVSEVRVSQFNEDVVRVVLGTQGLLEYAVTREGRRVLVTLLPHPPAPRPKPNPTNPPAHLKTVDYRLEVGDVLSIAISPGEELSQPRAVVLSGGEIEFPPPLGPMPAQGKTVEEFRVLLEVKLGKYFSNPKVTIALKSYGFRRVFVQGEVRGPGSHNFKEGMKLIELITLAGGFKELAKLEAVEVTRQVAEGGRETLTVNVQALMDSGEDWLLQPGDVVRVAKVVGDILVYGEVKSQGPYAYKRNFRITALLAKAGGLTDKAVPEHVRIIRGASEKNVIEVDLTKIFEGDLSHDLVLEPGDMVVVPRQGVQSFWAWVNDNILPAATLLTSLAALYVLLR